MNKENPSESYTNEQINQMSAHYRAAFVNSLTGFKSANLIGTQCPKGHTNLAIISSCIHLGSSPALIGFISRPNKSPRHTLENILKTGFYTINHVHKDFSIQAHQTSARYPRSTSEFKTCGLHEQYLDSFMAPFVQESSIKMSLKFIEKKHIEINDTNLIIGEIQKVYLPKGIVLQRGHIDIEKAGSIPVSGLDHYHQTSTLHSLSYAKPGQKVLKLKE